MKTPLRKLPRKFTYLFALLALAALVSGVTTPLSGTAVSKEILAINPKVLPEGEYPYWPEYTYLETADLATVRAQDWIDKEHTLNGWDWSLPPEIEPAPKGLVGLQRIIGLDKPFEPIHLQFKANAVGILWVKWRELEPTPGNYDFSRVIARIQQAREAGVDVILRILTCSKLRGNDDKALSQGEAPLWLEDMGVPLLPRKDERHNLNFDPANPVFHERYLQLVREVAKAGLPEMVKAAYVGYASHSFGDEGIGPFPENAAEKNDEFPHVRERLDAWQEAFAGMEHKVFMGGSSHYGFAKGFGVRRGFVEMYLYNIPSAPLGQYIDQGGYLAVDENAPILKYGCFNGEVNEEYEPGWASPQRQYRFGASTRSFPYRYFTSTLRALQMRCTYIHTTGHLIPEMLPFMALELGRTVADTPDVWTFLRTSYLGPTTYRNNDTRGRVITPLEKQEGIPARSFERWLYQRDAPGFETRPSVKIPHAIKMWMVANGKEYDYIARTGKRLGFHIDDRWPGQSGKLVIKVTFFDNAAGSFRLIFRTKAGLFQKAHPLTGDGKLKTSTFFISDVMPNGLVNGYDFILEAGQDSPEITVAMVRAIVIATE